MPNREKDATFVLRPWFEDPEVRKKLVKLMDTDVVKIMDKDFMHRLQNKLYESHWEAFEERLAARRKWESDRRKELALEGIQPLEDNSLDNHPIIQVKKEVEKAIDLIREETRKPYQTRKRMIRDYKQFKIEPDDEETSAMSSDESLFENNPIADVDYEELEKRTKELNVKRVEEPNLTTLMSEEFYQRIKYESPLVKELRAAETVDDMYDLAEQILESKQPYAPLTEEMIKTGLKVDLRTSVQQEQQQT